MLFFALLSLLPAGLLASPVKRSAPLGGAPNATTAADSSVLHLANFLENVEYALYSEACVNIPEREWVKAGFPKMFRQEVVCTTAAQEAVHLETIEATLKAAGMAPLLPCSYSFPYKGPTEFANLANMVTSVGIGAYIGGSLSLSDNIPLLTAAASILPVEARHSAALRYAHEHPLSPFPTAFDTPLTAAWAYNLALPFAYDCPAASLLPLPVLPALNLAGALPPHAPSPTPPTTVQFTWDSTKVSGGSYFAWLNQAQNATFVPVVSCGPGCGNSTVPAGVAGVAFVVLTDSSSTALTMTELSNATLAGPAEVVLS